jgi:predicted TIM-barrel fold metal-dependent hydrolase
MGEMLPFQLERIFPQSERWGDWKQGLREVLGEQYLDHDKYPPFAFLLQTISIDHVLYSVDYPFSTTEKGLQFFHEIEKSGLIAGKDLEMFVYRNVKSLLVLKHQHP